LVISSCLSRCLVKHSCLVTSTRANQTDAGGIEASGTENETR
jgi:hypothetical protein